MKKSIYFFVEISMPLLLYPAKLVRTAVG